MSMLPHVFEGLSLLLHGIVGTTGAEDLNRGGLNLHSLSTSDALHELSFDAEAGTSGDEFQQLLVELSSIGHYLYVLDGRTVVEGDEVHVLRTAM